MKNYIFVLLALSVISCKKEESEVKTVLLGTWELKEVLSDPGDGSGEFNTVDSDKTISFLEEGVIISNGNLCTMSIDANEGSTGTYSLDDSTIVSSFCSDFFPFEISFEHNNDVLIINYPCIEPCKVKFKKP